MAHVQTVVTGENNSTTHAVTLTSPPTEGTRQFAFINARGGANDGDLTIVGGGWTVVEVVEDSTTQKLWSRVTQAGDPQTITIDKNGTNSSSVAGVVEISQVLEPATIDVDFVFWNAPTELTTQSSPTLTGLPAEWQSMTFTGIRDGGDEGSFSATNGHTIQDDGKGTGSNISGGAISHKSGTTATDQTDISWTDAGQGIIMIAAVETSAGDAPDQPTVTSVNPITETGATVNGSTYSHSNSKAHAATQVQVATAAAPGTPVYDSGSLGPVESHQVPDGNLISGTDYVARIRYQDIDGQPTDWSLWSPDFPFTTLSGTISFTNTTDDGGNLLSGSIQFRWYPDSGVSGIAEPGNLAGTVETGTFTMTDGAGSFGAMGGDGWLELAWFDGVEWQTPPGSRATSS